MPGITVNGKNIVISNFPIQIERSFKFSKSLPLVKRNFGIIGKGMFFYPSTILPMIKYSLIFRTVSWDFWAPSPFNFRSDRSSFPGVFPFLMNSNYPRSVGERFQIRGYASWKNQSHIGQDLSFCGVLGSRLGIDELLIHDSKLTAVDQDSTKSNDQRNSFHYQFSQWCLIGTAVLGLFLIFWGWINFKRGRRVFWGV